MTTRNREIASIIDDSGNVTLSGNLTVTGNVVQASSTTTTYADNLLELNSGASSNTNDIGFVFERGSTGNNALLIWDESNDGFAVGTTTSTGSATGNISFTAVPFTGSIITASTSFRAPLIEYSDGTDAMSIASNGAVTATVSLTSPLVKGTTSLQTPLIEFTDGDNAIAIADGGGVTMASGLTSIASANTLGATSFNDANITNVGNIALDSISADGSTIVITGNTTFADGAYNFDIASHDSTNGLALGGTVVTSTAAELNLMDGGTSATSTTLAAADRVIVNDGGTMKQVALSDFETFFESDLDTFTTLTLSTSLRTPLIEFTDGDDAIVIADGGGVTIANFTGTGNLTGNASGSSGSTTGNAATATALATARTIGGTSFDGTANIAVALAATATEATNITAVANNSTNETVYPTFVDGATGTQGLETDTGFTYNPSTGVLTGTQFTGAVVGNVTGNASGTAATVTTAAQPAITSLGTLTGLAVSGNQTVGGTLGVTGITTLSTHLRMGDADKIQLGDSQEFSLYHAANNRSYVTSPDLELSINSFRLYTLNGVTGMITATASGVNLLQNTSITGTLGVTGVVTANAGVVIDTMTLDGYTIATSSGNFAIDSASDILLDAGGGNISLYDDGTLFGRLNHNGSNLKITSNISNGHIVLEPNGVGNVYANTDMLSITGTEGESSTLMLQADESDDAGDDWAFTSNTNNTLTIGNDIASAGTSVAQLTLTPHATVASSTTAIAGHLVVSGNMTVDGTTTTINSTTISVDDKNIELGSVGSPSDSTADGGGITLKGASDKTILWTNSTDSWDFNQAVRSTNGFIGNLTGNASGTALTVTQAAQTAITSVGTLTGLAVNSGATNVVASFTSTDGYGAIQLADNAGNVELTAVGNDFHIQNAGGAAKMVVLNSGNVGIGITAPLTQLHTVLASSNTNTPTDVLRLGHTTSGSSAVGFGTLIRFDAERTGSTTDGFGKIGFVADVMTSSRVDGAFVVQTGIDGSYTERMRITSEGDVKIGTASGAGGTLIIEDNSKSVTIAPNSSDTIYYDQANLGIRANTLINIMPGGTTKLSVASAATTITGNLIVSGTISAATTLSSFTDRIRIINGSDQMNIGQWDTATHRIEGDASRPISIQSYHTGTGILLGASGNTKLQVLPAGVTVTGTLGVSGVLTADAGIDVDNFNIDGTTISLSSGDQMTLDSAGRIDLSADDNGEIRLFDGSSMYAQFKDDDDRLSIQGLLADKDILFVVNDGGTPATALKLDAANAGAATFYGATTFNSHVYLGNNTIIPASNYADQTGIALKYSTTVPEIQVSSDAQAMQLGRTSTGGAGSILVLRSASNIVHDFNATASGMLSVHKTNSSTAANNAGGGFYGVSSGTQGSRNVQMWLDADGANFSGSDYFYAEKVGGGVARLVQQANAALELRTNGTLRQNIDATGNIQFGPHAADIQIKPHSLNSGHGEIYMRGNASNERSTIILNHYGHADFRIQAGAVGNGKFSIGNSDTDPHFVMLTSGNVGIGHATPTAKFQVEGTFTVRSSTSSIFNDGNNAENVRMFNSGTTFNADGIDKDFTVLSDDNAAMLFVDGGNDRVGIGTDSPDQKLHVYGAASGAGVAAGICPLVVENNSHCMMQFLSPNNVQQGFYFGDPQSNTAGELAYEHNTNAMSFYTAGLKRFGLDSSGHARMFVANAVISQAADNSSLRLQGGNSYIGGAIILNGGSAGGQIHFHSTTSTGNYGTAIASVTADGFVPGTDSVSDLGSTALRWANLYTGDLHLSNTGNKVNEMDGTNGDWTIQEGEEHLYIKNNKSGKKYKFALVEIT